MQITVQYVNQPKAGKKMGSVKDTTGALYGVWPDKLGLFQPGKAYEIEFKTSEGGFKSITKFSPVGGGELGAQRGNGAAPKTNNGQFRTPKEMVISELVSAALYGAGDIPEEQVLLGWFARIGNAWDKFSLGPQPVRSGDREIELNDEIPF